MRIETEHYLEQLEHWPTAGRHILAQFDETSIVVYQAYRPEIGKFAASYGYFGGAFSLARMSWIKPNFLWMMYRSGWAQKEGQEVVLAVRIKRCAFDQILARAIHSSFAPEHYESQEEWRKQGLCTDARMQWDPDHTPNGSKEVRRAIQLGIRGEFLGHYSKDWIIDIEDISSFVHQQSGNLGSLSELVTPRERVYPVVDSSIAKRLGIDVWRE